MITVKRDAIKYKTPEGMQSAGVLCNVGTFGVDMLKYAHNISFAQNDNNLNQLPEIVDIDLPSLTASSKFFYGHSNTTPRVIRLGLNTEKIYQATSWFEYCRVLGIVEFKQGAKLSIISSIFNGCFALKEVRGVIDLSTSWQTNNAFEGCSLLEEIRFKENSIPISISFKSCKALSNQTIQSISNGLADLTGQTAQTITFHKDIEAKLSDEQKAQITSKNWTLAFSK